MAAEVTKRFQSTPYQKRLEVILGDVMKTELPYFDVCISNTPYQVRTTPNLLRTFFPILTESRSLLLSHSNS
jgi:16S rRNA A1518/A1519 N6-dimethyltransferase RsmA/KsgA/DIM1 with predicted DNA glycosylase/AP lyase activity